MTRTGILTAACIAELQRIAQDVAVEHLCPSISWGVVVDGRLAHHGHVGSLDDGATPSAATVYRIASMTKSFTAATVLALRDEGVWNLDDPIAHHAPELRTVTGPLGSPPITLRQLLSMASGLATDDAWADRHLDITPSEIDKIYAGGPMFAHMPNVTYEYSNLGFAMIGRAIERASGKRTQQHIDERFLGPLGMTRTTWVQPDHDDWARPYRTEDGRIVRDPPEPVGDGDLAPMGGLWTTVADMTRWVAWLNMANVVATDDHCLSAASRREMQRMQTYMGMVTVGGRSCPTGYGLGLNVRDDPELGKIVSHAGGLPGYGSSMRWFAGRGLGVVAMSNTFYAPMSVLTMRLLVALHEHSAVPAPAVVDAPLWTAAVHRLVDLLNDWDDAVANELFEDNVVLDESFARRRKEAADVVATNGKLRVVSRRPASATNGDFEVQGSGEPIRVYLELSPTPGAPVQAYTIHG